MNGERAPLKRLRVEGKVAPVKVAIVFRYVVSRAAYEIDACLAEKVRRPWHVPGRGNQGRSLSPQQPSERERFILRVARRIYQRNSRGIHAEGFGGGGED